MSRDLWNEERLERWRALCLQGCGRALSLSFPLSLSLSLSLPLSLSLTCEDGVCGRAFFLLARVRTQMSIEICGERKSEGERERERVILIFKRNDEYLGTF